MCPDCDSPLVILELNGIELDYCTDCCGTWLDQGELEMLLDLEKCDYGELSDAIHSQKSIGKTKRRCPRCSAKMELISIGVETPVEVDRCPRNHGLWFDRGEIQAIIKQYQHGEPGCVAAFFASVYEHDLKKNSET